MLKHAIFCTLVIHEDGFVLLLTSPYHAQIQHMSGPVAAHYNFLLKVKSSLREADSTANITTHIGTN